MCAAEIADMADDGKHSRWKSAALFARIAIAAGIIFYIIRRIPADDWTHIEDLFNGNWPALLAGIAATGLGLTAGALRWHYLLARRRIDVSLLTSTRIFFVGQFFNAFMLGACGGDVARVYYVIRETSASRTRAASTVIADRAIGLFALALFSIVMILLRLPFFLGHRSTKAVGVFMAMFVLGFVGAALLCFRRNLFERSRLLAALEEKTRVGPFVRKAYEALYEYRNDPAALAITMALSLLNLAFLTLAAYAFGACLGVSNPLVDYFTLFPVITVIAAVPITPGALGVREYSFVAMFGAVGVGQLRAMTLSLLVYFGGLVWSLLGGLLFVGHSAGTGRSMRSELEDLREQHLVKDA